MAKRPMNGLVALVAAAAAMVGFASAGSAADDVAAFYSGKTIRVIVASPAGSGYDSYARLMTRHMGKYLPGHPGFIVQNMPGAGSITAANHVYNVAPQDGTVIGAIQRSSLFMQILGEPGPQYDVDKFKWMGSLNNEVGVIYTWGTSRVKTFDDLTKYELIFGSAGPNETEAFPAMLINMIGAKIKLVSGYTAAPEISLAAERGEVEGVSLSWSTLKTLHPDWIAQKKVNLLAQMSMTKHPDLPDVPLIMDLVNARNLLPGYTEAEAQTLWKMMLAQKAVGRPFVLGPGVPEDRSAALRKAFDDMLLDRDFIADAEKSKIDIVPVSGAEIQTMVGQLAAAPRALLDRLEEITKYKR